MVHTEGDWFLRLLDRCSNYLKVLGTVTYILKWPSILKNRGSSLKVPGAKSVEDVH